MADFTRFTGGGDIISDGGANNGQHFETVLVRQGAVGMPGTYANISNVSQGANRDPNNADFNPNFATTLYYIRA